MTRSTLFIIGLALASGWAALASAEGKREPFPPMRAPFYELTRDGRPLAAIITSASPSRAEKHAIDEFLSAVKKMTGVDLPTSASGSEAHYPIYIGGEARKRLPEFDWPSLGSEGFLLRSTAEGLYVAGAKDLGTIYGVYTLLERFGMRWFMPGPLGEVAPAIANLQTGTLDEAQTPSFTYRWVEDGPWALRNKMNIAVEAGGEPIGPQWRWSFHTHFYLVPPEEYYEAHPGWFALCGGRRRRPEGKRQQSHQLCTSNPDLIEEMARNIIAYFKKNPEVDILSLAPQDGGGFCECAACRALDEDRPEDEAWHARYSNRLAVFNNEVARRVAKVYPKKIIKVGAYAMYLRVPADPAYRPEPNLAVQVCHTYSCNNHPIDSDCPRQMKYFREDLERWGEIANHLFIYEYYRKGMWGEMPYDQVHVIRHDLPYFKRIGVEGFFTQAAGDHWPACGLNHYIAAKLTWDAALDVDALLEDYYRAFFSEAAAPMRGYYEGLMGAFEDYDDCISPYGYKWPTFAASEIFTPGVMALLDGALSSAESAANTPAVVERIRPIRARLEYVKQVLAYLKAVRAPFDGVDLSDKSRLEEAHQSAIEIGEPLSRKIKAFCKANNIRSFDRIDAAHKNQRFLVILPDQEPLLR